MSPENESDRFHRAWVDINEFNTGVFSRLDRQNSAFPSVTAV